jgi:membrane protease YdiL (CAAX protease family)
MEMGHTIHVFDLAAKVIIMVGIMAYAFLRGVPMNAPDGKFLTPWLLVALIPFVDNTIDYFRIPNQWPDGMEFVSIVATMLTTAAWEEMLFRYVGKSLFERNGKYHIGAVVLLALTFGCSHLINIFFYDPVSILLQVLHASISGVFLLALYRRTGNLWVTIIAHFLQNFGAAFFDLFPESEQLIQSPVLFILSTVVQLAIGVYILVKYRYVTRKTDENPSRSLTA